MKVQDGGRTYDVVIIGSLGVNPGVQAGEQHGRSGIADEFTRAFQGQSLAAVRCAARFASGDVHTWRKNTRSSGRAARIPFIDPADTRRSLIIAKLRGLHETGGLACRSAKFPPLRTPFVVIVVSPAK